MSPLEKALSDLKIHPFLRLALREANLSPREAQVLALALQGSDQREIASELHTSQNRVCEILERIRQKAVSKLPFPPIYL